MSWLDFAGLVLVRLDAAICIYFFFVNSCYALLLASAAWEMLCHARALRGERLVSGLSSGLAPSISLLAPAYNEAATVRESVGALLSLSYPGLEMVLVNDGSTDETLAVLKTHFELVPLYPIYRKHLVTKPVRGLYRSRRFPDLLVVDKENGGKADALNAGLQLASGELVCSIDADTLIEPDALLRMVRPFLESEAVLGAGGTIRVANGSRFHHGRVTAPRVPRRALEGIQVVEYLRAFLFGRLGWNRLGGNMIIAGAFGLFRREAVIEAGGYASDTVGEDMELVLRLRRRAYESRTRHRITFIPDPVAWTEVPARAHILGRQRDRWHRGLAEVLWRHRAVLCNPRYKALGLVVFPYFVFVELLAPVVEILGLAGIGAGLALGLIDVPFALLFFAVAYAYGVVLSAAALVLEELNFHRYERLWERLLLLVWAAVEPLGYRQLTVLWRLQGLFKFLRKRKDWGAMERRGFGAMPVRLPKTESSR